jgi:hypothetical protein
MTAASNDFYQSNQIDLFSQLIKSAVGAWTQGVQALVEMAAGGVGEQGGAGLSDIAGQVRATMRPLTELVPGALEICGAGRVGEEALARMLDFSPALAHAYVACAASTVRYWGSLAELFIGYETRLLKAAADRAAGQDPVSANQSRMLADDLRTFLREIGDTAAREAQRLQYDLAKVGEEIAQATDRATPSPHPDHNPRRHEVKP